MKRLLLSAFAICLATAAPTALWAADDNHDKTTHPGGAMGGPSVHHDTGTTGTGHHDMMSTGTTHTYTKGTARTHHTYTRTNHTTINNHTTVNNRTNVHANVDVSSYRKTITADHHYHYGDYHAPAGYSYHRWNSGDNLPREYWAQEYWINNYLNFGLVAPPDGYVWVRYGPDAVLIDEDTGEIVQVVYGLFY